MMIKRLKSLLRILLSPLVFFWVGTREFWRFLNSLDPANPREIKLHEFVGTVLILLGATMFCFQVNSCGAKDNTPVPSPLTTYPMTVHPRVVWSQAVTSGTDISADVGLTESDGSLYAVGQNGDVSALNEETGKVLWRVRLGEIIASKPTVYAGKVYIGLLEGGLVVLEAKTGQTLWTKPMTSSIEAPIAVTDTLIVIHLHDGSVVALDPNTHAQLWMYDASSSPDLGLPQDSGAVLTDRTAILGFTNGQLISFDLRNGQVAWTRPIAFQDGSTEVERMVDVGTSILSGDTLYSAAYHGNVVSLDAMTGRLNWQHPMSVFNQLFLKSGYLIVDDAQSNLYALDAATGRTLWVQKSLQNRWLTSPLVIGDHVVVGDYQGYLHFASLETGALEGRVKLSRKAVDRLTGVVVGDAGYFMSKDGTVSKVVL